MSNLTLRHPEEGQLLRYLDGELPRGKANQVRSHLEACWQCRSQVEELQVAVGDCVRYRKNVLGACLPPPPAPWKALDFEKAEAELAGQSVFARLRNFLSPRRNAPLGWAMSFAAVVALAVGIFQQLRETPKVEAAVLLKKAIAVSQSRPVGGTPAANYHPDRAHDARDRGRLRVRKLHRSRIRDPTCRPFPGRPLRLERSPQRECLRRLARPALAQTGRGRLRHEFLRHQDHHRR